MMRHDIYAKRGEERRLPAHDSKPDYYNIRLIRHNGQRCFLSTRREFFPFAEEKDRIPAWLSARAHAAWPRPDGIDEGENCFIVRGEKIPYRPDDPLHRRYTLDWLTLREHKKRLAAQPTAAAENESSGIEYTI